MAKVFAPFAYPPFLFIILSPLTVLPFIIAGKVWATLSILFFLASLYVLITVCDGHKPDHMTVIAIAILVATFFPAKTKVRSVQIFPV